MPRSLTLTSFPGGQAPSRAVTRTATVRQLQDRISRMQDGVPRLPVATHPALDGLLDLRTGGAYEVGSAVLAMALLGPPTQAGAWVAVVGAGDFGIEAAAELGVDLSRMVLVPDPGEHWLEVTAALVDVVTMVLLRPPAGVNARTAGRIGARLRKRSAVLVAEVEAGGWPGSEARLAVESSAWSGPDRGHGRLSGRRVVVSVSRGAAPVRRVRLELDADSGLRRAETPTAPSMVEVG